MGGKEREKERGREREGRGEAGIEKWRRGGARERGSQWMNEN